jgi:hypothetical protein
MKVVGTMENSMGAPQKTKNGTTIWPSNTTPRHIFEGVKIPAHPSLLWH